MLFFSRAESFDPDRWLPGGDARAAKDNEAYWPYGGGPRVCIGEGFAMVEGILVRFRQKTLQVMLRKADWKERIRKFEGFV